MKPTSIKKVKPDFQDIRNWYEQNLAPEKIDHNDQKVYENIYHDGKFCGIFQCTSRGAQKFFIKAKPQSIIDIAALTSIYRPGPLAAHLDKIWLQDELYDWGHPLVNETLKDTKNCCVFQESVMELAHKVAGFPLEQCDEVRRAIMKRSISGGEAAKQKAQALEDDFVKGAIKNGVPEHIAKDVYQKILFFAGYAFNKCLMKNTKINVFKNDKIYATQIQNIKSGDIVLSRDELTQQNICVKVKKRHKQGIKKLVKVTLTTGEEICCTLDHKFRVQETNEMLPLWMILKKKLSIIVNSVKKDIHQ